MSNTLYNPRNAGDAFNQEADPYDFREITLADREIAVERLDELVEQTRESLGDTL